MTWDRAVAPVVGLLGPRVLSERLARTLRVERFRPTAAPAEEVDAVLVARSAVAPGGSWAGALRPGWFDRGVALDRVLRTAGERGQPVVLLEDLPTDALDGWHRILDGAIDDALLPGPLGAGGVCWHPGIHWDPMALRLAAATGRHLAAPVDLDGSQWRTAQRAAAAAGRATTTAAEDPWQRHLIAELAQLGVAVRDGTGAVAPSFDDATPWSAAAWLCDHLGLPAPRSRPLVLLHHAAPPERLLARLARELGRDVRHVATGRPLPAAAVVAAAPDGAWDDVAAMACATALDRLGDEPEVVVRFRDTVAATAGVAAALAPATAHALLTPTAVDLGALL